MLDPYMGDGAKNVKGGGTGGLVAQETGTHFVEDERQ